MSDREHFPKKVYGICSIGHNIRPSGETGDDISTTQIGEGEPRRLYWSSYYQAYVCKPHLRRVPDKKHEVRFHQDQLRFERALKAMGFVTEPD